MNKDNYFQPYKGSFWQWEDAGNVLSIPGGRTIAYSSHVSDVIYKMHGQGLPYFGALLLAIAALNPGGKHDIDYIISKLRASSRNGFDTTFNYAQKFLNILTEVPKEYKSGDKKILLLRAIFQDCHQILSLKNSKAIAESCHLDSIPVTQPIEPTAGVLNYDITVIALIYKKLESVDDILKKIAALPELDEFDFDPEPTIDEQPDDLLDQLIEHPKTFKTGALIKTLWAGLKIPQQDSSPSQQPIGGVADITNKGELDKLLISEFAYDDLTLLSRLANNEALYLNRESPPLSNTKTRNILIDVSIKNWGTPKILAFATALAIKDHPKSQFETQIYLVGNQCDHYPSSSIHDIIKAIQVTDATLDCSEGIEDYFNHFHPPKDCEVFLISEQTTQLQNRLFNALTRYKNEIQYVLQTNSQGKFRSFKIKIKARK